MSAIDQVTCRVGHGQYGKTCWVYEGTPLTSTYHCVIWTQLPADYYTRQS